VSSHRGDGEAFYAAIAPHNPLGPISLAAGIQLAASIPNFLCQEQSSLGVGYIKKPFEVRDSYIDIPTSPGWELNWTKKRSPTKSITTGATGKPTTRTMARWSTGNFRASTESVENIRL
jgi:hypothetical protein